MARADWTHFWLCVGGCCSARVRGVARGRELGLQNQLVRPAVTIRPYAFAGVRNLLWWTLDDGRSGPYEMPDSEWTPSALYVWLWRNVRRSMKRMFMTSRVEDAHGEEVADISVSFCCFPTSKISSTTAKNIPLIATDSNPSLTVAMSFKPLQNMHMDLINQHISF